MLALFVLIKCIIDDQGKVIYQKVPAIPLKPTNTVPSSESFFKIDIKEIIKNIKY
jgi:hypothetical protein